MARNKSEEALKLQARVVQLEKQLLQRRSPLSPGPEMVDMIRLVEEAREKAVIYRARLAVALPPPVGYEFWDMNRFPWEDDQDEDR